MSAGRNFADVKTLLQLRNYLSKFVSDKSVDVANQEFTQLVQRFQGSFWKYLDAKEDPKLIEDKKEVKVQPKWKEAPVKISREAVAAQTQHILTLLTSASSNQSILKRIEDLNHHLNQYSDAKHIAEKSNAVRLLLRIKHKTRNDQVQSAVNETLTLLGHVSPVKGKGVRVLSIDGGGVRGILVLEMLKKLEELTGKRTQDMFDLICGVSTGAIIATLLGVQHSLDDISEIYRDLSTQIFTQSAIKGTSSLVWSHSYYDTALWEKLLKEKMGEQSLISTSRTNCPKICIVSAVVNQSPLSAYIFRNYTLSCHVHSKYEGSHKHLLWEAVRASAAAPTYFEEFRLGTKLHQDGGLLFNNPTAVAIHEARLLWPQTPIQCVLSFGTGRTIPVPMAPCDAKTVRGSSWKNKFYAVIESATDTEGVHTVLSDLLPERIYYRFNPYLTEMMDMAEIDGKKLEQLKRDAVMYLRRNEDKFQEAARVLAEERGLGQKVGDWLSLQKDIVGLKLT